MNCMECAQSGVARAAVALCHSCSAALCLDHAVVVQRKLDRHTQLFQIETLPLPVRAVLCASCKAALEQPHLPMTEHVAP